MQIDLRKDLPDTRIAKEFRRFLSWTGENAWKGKIEKLQKLPRLSKQNLYARYLANKNPLTSAINEFSSLDQSGKSIVKHVTNDFMKVAGYAYVFNRMVHQGSERLKTTLKGMVLDDNTVRSLLFEIDVATNFFRRGYDVKFMDMEAQANYDLLIYDGKMSLEVECKRKSADAGRKIPRPAFYLLADMLFSRLENAGEKFLLDIDCEGRIGSDQRLFLQLAYEVQKGLDRKVNSGQVEHIRFVITHLPSTLVLSSDEEAAQILAPYWSGSAHFAILSGETTTLVVKCESTKTDQVLESIYDELRQGATQFTKTTPALLACFIEDVDDAAWSELARKSGLQVMTHKLFSSSDRSHLWRVVYSSDQTPVKQDSNILEFHATTLSWENRECRFSMPKPYMGFGTDDSGSSA